MLQKEVLLAHFPKLTNKRWQEIHSAFSDVDAFWHSYFDEIKNKLHWDDNLIHEFLLWKDELNEEVIEKRLVDTGIHCITQHDPEYPELLKQIYDPPFCLFIRGSLESLDFPLGVVGTRKFTPYGKQVTEELISDLAKQGVTIVSGLALGIDGIAHEATIRANGTTIAVLGGGVDAARLYPAAHKYLAERIINSGGAVISEYPPGTLPTQFSFPRRNRIIAGLSLGTLVIEAGENSGALITAQCSLDSNREVFAVPQNITSPTATGPNNLLKMGAKPVTCAKDILDALNLQNIQQFVETKEVIPDSPTEAAILPHLSREPIHIDDITKRSGLASHVVNGAMTLMEMKGKVRNLGGMMYVIGR